MQSCALRIGALLLSTPAFAGASRSLPKGVSAGPCVDDICEYVPNGLRVLLFPYATTSAVTLNLVSGVGSLHESYGETGMTHLLEHPLFQGTPTRTDIPGEMTRGASYEATTGLDRSNYFAAFPASDETPDWLLAMEADRMVNSTLAQSDLDSEIGLWCATGWRRAKTIRQRAAAARAQRGEDTVVASIINGHLQFGRGWPIEANRDAVDAA